MTGTIDEKALRYAGVAVLNKIESAQIIPGTYVPAYDLAETAIRAYLSSLTTAPPAAGTVEGWKTVPVEPTREMILAAYDRDRDGTTQLYYKTWAAMLSASPPPPVSVKP